MKRLEQRRFEWGFFCTYFRPLYFEWLNFCGIPKIPHTSILPYDARTHNSNIFRSLFIIQSKSLPPSRNIKPLISINENADPSGFPSRRQPSRRPQRHHVHESKPYPLYSSSSSSTPHPTQSSGLSFPPSSYY